MSEIIKDCEIKIREGNISEVSEILKSIDKQDIAVEEFQTFANLCLRTGNFDLGLQVLTPLIRPGSQSELRPPKNQELSEYAILLQRAGSVPEALSILNQINPDEYQKINFYKALCLFDTWDYQKSLSYLNQYTENETDLYMKMVGKLNIGIALVALDRYNEAIDSLKPLAKSFSKKKHWPLYSKTCELLAQAYILKMSFYEAEKFLDEAEKYSWKKGSIDSLYIEKCRALYTCLKTGDLSQLLTFKQSALNHSHFENLREVDLFFLMRKFDENILNKLYLGTPYNGYHKRIERLFDLPKLPQSWVYGPTKTLFNPASGTLNDQVLFEPGSEANRVLQALAADLYKPQNINNLFSMLYPGEYFNIFNSPNRVHKALSRTRKVLENSSLPLNINYFEKGYQIFPTSFCGIYLQKNRKPITVFDSRMGSLKESLWSTEFSVNEVQTILEVSPATAQRVLKEATQKGLLEKFGAGKTTKYYFNEKQIKSA